MPSRDYITHTVSSTAPVGARAGDEWYDPATNVLRKDLVSNGTTPVFNQVITVDNTGTANIVGAVSVTGNVTGGNVLTVGLISATGNITTAGALVVGANLYVSNAIVSGTTSIASAANITPTTGTNQYNVTALAVAANIATPTGTAALDGQKLMIRIKDNGGARALIWITTAGAYRAVGVTLPTTTVLGKTLYVGCVYNSQDVFWDVIAIAQQA